MRAYAAAERLSRGLGDISQAYLACLRPTAEALGSKLGIAQDTCSLFPEEVQMCADPEVDTDKVSDRRSKGMSLLLPDNFCNASSACSALQNPCEVFESLGIALLKEASA